MQGSVQQIRIIEGIGNQLRFKMKYDKEEAERVYKESLKEYNKKQENRHPADKLDEQAENAALIFMITCILIFGLFSLISYFC